MSELPAECVVELTSDSLNTAVPEVSLGDQDQPFAVSEVFNIDDNVRSDISSATTHPETELDFNLP
jgi:hypothetical protein